MPQITNVNNLPEPLYQLVLKLADYTRKSDYSVTELVKSIRQVLLYQRHKDEIVEDVSDSLWRLLGILLHLALEQVDVMNHLQEEHIRINILGKVLSGRTDLYSHEKKIIDYKLTSAWSAIFKNQYEEWEEQINMLVFLFRSIGFEVNAGEIFVIYRDWSRSNALKNKDYPQKNNEIINIPIRSFEKQKKWVEGKLISLIAYEDTPDDELPECTAEEMWEKPTTYALMKEGRKSAVRVFNEKMDLIQYGIANNCINPLDYKGLDKYSIETRHGERTRCEHYCACAPFCNQFKLYNQNKEVVKNDGKSTAEGK